MRGRTKYGCTCRASWPAHASREQARRENVLPRAARCVATLSRPSGTHRPSLIAEGRPGQRLHVLSCLQSCSPASLRALRARVPRDAFCGRRGTASAGQPRGSLYMYSPARSAVSVESEDGWVVWFSAEAPDGKPRRARPPRAPAPKLTVPKPVHQDGGMGQTLGELASALADALGRRDAALSERDAAVAERDAAVAALAAAKKPANGHAATKRRSPAKTPPRSQKASKPSPAAVSRSPASSKARSPPKRAPASSSRFRRRRCRSCRRCAAWSAR